MARCERRKYFVSGGQHRDRQQDADADEHANKL